MPELPEVETVRRSLADALSGVSILSARSFHPRVMRRQPRPRDFTDRLVDRRIEGFDRHGKFLQVRIEGDLTLIIHLGMSGRVRLVGSDTPRLPHTHVEIRTTGPQDVHFVDPRTFGFLAVYTPEELESQPFSRLGPDALNSLPRSAQLQDRMARRSVAIKTVLLDQSVLAGLGNIYADEVLHRARIRPDRPANELAQHEVVAIRESIRPILEAGLRWGGTSLDDLAYLLPDDRAGRYLARLAVYGRAGEACRRCGDTVVKTVLAARSSHWCPSCQR